MFVLLANTILSVFKAIFQIIGSLLDGLFTGVKQILDGIIMIFKGDFKNGIISIGKGILNILIGIINGFIHGLNAILYPIRELIVQAGNILGQNWSLGTISIPTIPKLASGAIVNLPGRGVYSNGTIRGEAGAEGVLPLTDSQTMETLGEAIGRYIVLNVNLETKLDSKTISRKVFKTKANQDFAYNN